MQDNGQDKNPEINIDFDILDEYWAERYEDEFGRFFNM